MSVAEGFICPVCMKSFGRVELLELHFKEHGDESKHKHKTENISLEGVDHSFYSDQNVCPATEGVTLSHTAEFIKHRKESLSTMAVKMNDLVIKLEQIMYFKPDTGLKRKEYEQTVVPWIGEEVNLCPFCGANFGVGTEFLVDNTKRYSSQRRPSISDKFSKMLDTDLVFRRKHHCRLCGFVMCADCSLLVDEKEIQETLRVIQSNSLEFTLRHEFEAALSNSTGERKNNGIDVDGTAASSSYENFRDRFSRKYGYLLRLCHYCKDLLVRKVRISQTTEQESTPFQRVYDSLMNYIDQVQEEMPLYKEMHASLSGGEAKFSLEIARQQRTEIFAALQTIDALSKQIDSLINQSNPEEVASIRLWRKVSARSKRFLQINLPSLQCLPSEEELLRLMNERKAKDAHKWMQNDQEISNLEKMAAKKHPSTANLTYPLETRVRATSSWVPESQTRQINDFSKYGLERDDPELTSLIQQIDLVSGFLDQAKRAKRSEDELLTLSKNLTELQQALSEKLSCK